MSFRIAILLAAGALTIGPGINAQQPGVSTGNAFASRPTEQTTAQQNRRPRTIQGQRDVLEMIGENLELSHQQKYQLESLIGRQRQMLTALHQHTDLSDEQKSAQFQAIRRQTKEQFVAILTRQQREEFESMMR